MPPTPIHAWATLLLGETRFGRAVAHPGIRLNAPAAADAARNCLLFIVCSLVLSVCRPSNHAGTLTQTGKGEPSQFYATGQHGRTCDRLASMHIDCGCMAVDRLGAGTPSSPIESRQTPVSSRGEGAPAPVGGTKSQLRPSSLLLLTADGGDGVAAGDMEEAEVDRVGDVLDTRVDPALGLG